VQSEDDDDDDDDDDDKRTGTKSGKSCSLEGDETR